MVIKADDLNDFLHSNVRITIEKINESNNTRGFLNFAGSLNKNDAEFIKRQVEECRKIDFGTWQ